jgi:hypothetical protein
VADGWLALAVRYCFHAPDKRLQFNHKAISSALLLFVLLCGT